MVSPCRQHQLSGTNWSRVPVPGSHRYQVGHSDSTRSPSKPRSRAMINLKEPILNAELPFAGIDKPRKMQRD